VGGGGAIDLAMHLNNLDFKAAVEWLWDRFPQPDLRESVLPSRDRYLSELARHKNLSPVVSHRSRQRIGQFRTPRFLAEASIFSTSVMTGSEIKYSLH